MRLSKDHEGWHADGVRRRDFRHDFSTPEIPRGHPKRKRRPSRRSRCTCKHVWVEVSYDEYCRYIGGQSWPSWLYPSIDSYLHSYEEYTTYFVCAGCGKGKRKVDEGALRVHYRRARAARLRARREERRERSSTS